MMKKLSEMQIAKEAVLTEIEVSDKGGRPVGFGTDYYGPSNPSSIYTYVDNEPWGPDESSGSLFGDSWDIYAYKFEPSPDFGKMLVSERR